MAANILFTPENTVDIQRSIGADIIMALDECTPGTADYQYAKKSMELTHQWLKRGIKRFEETVPKYGYSQAFFPIVQGCIYPDLRKNWLRLLLLKIEMGMLLEDYQWVNQRKKCMK